MYLNVRAVYIELVPNMSTHQFVPAFTRFTNVYDIPLHLYSDYAKFFITGGEILQKFCHIPRPLPFSSCSSAVEAISCVCVCPYLTLH